MMSSPKRIKKEKMDSEERQMETLPKLFKGIFEHQVEDLPPNDRPKDQSLIALHGFPVAPDQRDQELVSVTLLDKKMKKKKSIFAQQFEHSNLNSFGLTPRVVRREIGAQISDKSVVESHLESKASDVSCPPRDTMHSGMDWNSVETSAEMKTIDVENRDRLAGMTESEILAERRNILDSSDPLLSLMASYLRNRKQNDKTPDEVEKKDGVNSDVCLSAGAKAELDYDDLPVKPRPEWVHMDQLEHEKLSWMKDLPLPSADSRQTGRPARFDFAGNLVAPESDVPVHLGLHHHGDEPERAGYSLPELFQLSRSANLQQRVIALTTLGRIVRNARRGEFSDLLSSPVIPGLLDGGFVFLLRWALDDDAQSSVAASVRALHSLLVCGEDETAADGVFCWHDGFTMPSFQSPAAEKNDDEERPSSDGEIVKNDVVKGLLRMRLPERLRYLLEVCRPDAPVVILIFEILIRLARHSSEAAYQVFKCPRLIDVVVTEFLPSTWTPQTASDKSLQSVYGLPLATAVKFIRVLCSAGRNIAAFLLSKYNILRYVTEEPGEMDLPIDVSYDVCLESWRLWVVLLQYGLTLNIYCDFFHIVMERMRKLITSSYPLDRCPSSLGSTLCLVVEATVHCAAEVSRRLGSSQRRNPVLESDGGDLQPLQPVIPAFSWSPVVGLFPLFSEFCVKTLQHFVNFYFEKPYNLDLATASINLLASYYGRINDQQQCDPLKVEKETLVLCSDHLVPCLKSRSFALSLQFVRNHSMFDSTLSNSKENTLDSLKTLVGDVKMPLPVLDPRSTVSFLISLSRLLIALGKLNRSIVDKAFSLFLNHEDLLSYVRRICRHGNCSIAANYFCRFECEFHYNLVYMAQMKSFEVDDSSDRIDSTLYHFLALNLLSRLNTGDEYLGHSVMSSVIFNIEFLRDLSSSLDVGSSEAESLEDRLRLNDSEPLSNATQQRFNVSKSRLFKDLTESLASMRSTYLTSAPVNPSHLVESRNRWLHCCFDRASLLCGSVGHLLVPVDWVFLPLVQVHNHSLDPSVSDKEQLPSGLVTKVKDSLRAFYLLEMLRPDALKTILPAVKLSRLLFAFLAGNDLFLDEIVHSYLAELLKLYCSPKYLDRFDFTSAIPGISSFHDLYRQLVAQYESVSFGDALFACYLLLPLQQGHGVGLRIILWDENVAALRSIFVSVKELLIPIERFLEPEETELHLLRRYFQALFSRTILPNRCPVPYLIAVHHVNRFIYTVDKANRKLQSDMIRALLTSDNKELQHHVLFYKRVNVECQNAFELYDELPVHRQRTIDEIRRFIDAVSQ